MNGTGLATRLSRRCPQPRAQLQSSASSTSPRCGCWSARRASLRAWGAPPTSSGSEGRSARCSRGGGARRASRRKWRSCFRTLRRTHSSRGGARPAACRTACRATRGGACEPSRPSPSTRPCTTSLPTTASAALRSERGAAAGPSGPRRGTRLCSPRLARRPTTRGLCRGWSGTTRPSRRRTSGSKAAATSSSRFTSTRPASPPAGSTPSPHRRPRRGRGRRPAPPRQRGAEPAPWCGCRGR
mmetsp:Transcript_18196/g.52684  ORF Transcript_18196/g.52684 Transcript_18196/m.52684 type:complete len:242 (+) Transcript_18196:772-1497(+)